MLQDTDPAPQGCLETLDAVGRALQAEHRTSSKRAVLAGQAGCWRARGKAGFPTFLSEELRPMLSPHNPLYATALEMENLFLIDQGRYKEAAANYRELAGRFEADSLLHQQALFGLGYIHSIVNQNARDGSTFFGELQARYPRASLAVEAGRMARTYGFDQQVEAVAAKVRTEQQVPAVSNHPNPFNPVTRIRYRLPDQARVQLTVFNLLGRKVATLVDKTQSAGTYEVPFDATSLASGVYLYRLQTGQTVITRRMTVLK